MEQLPPTNSLIPLYRTIDIFAVDGSRIMQALSSIRSAEAASIQ